jgi:hypothetical protein
MSLVDLITNLTLTLKKHVDNNHIDGVTMLTILTDTLNNFCSKLNDPKFNLYKHVNQKTTSDIFNNIIINSNVHTNNYTNDAFDNLDPFILNDNICNNLPKHSAKHLSAKKKWSDYDDSDDGLKTNELYISEYAPRNDPVCIKRISNRYDDKKQKKDKNFKKNDKETDYVDGHKVPIRKKNDLYDKKLYKLNPETSLKYQKNCERTITYFINNYKVGHFDSANSIQDLNLIIARLLGINFNDSTPCAYSDVCWFMRNTKCYFSDCAANHHNMCTYAHPHNPKITQYCCVDDDEYDSWPDNYYKCLKMNFNDDVNAFILKNGDNLLPINTYKSIPLCIIDWYEYMADILLNI